MAISTDDLSGAEQVAQKVGISFPILYDPPAEVVGAYGVFDVLNDGLPAPSTFVIDKAGVIRWKYVADRYYDRPSADTVLEQIRLIEG